MQLTKELRQLDTFHIAQAQSLQARLYCTAWPYQTPPLQPLSLKAPMLIVTADFDVE
jgi:hypothetical protein